MPYRSFHFWMGVAMTLGCAILGLTLARLPYLEMFGPLTISLFLGMTWRALLTVPESSYPGVNFSSRTLLRCGIILLGVKIDFDLIARSGLSIFALGFGVVVAGLLIFRFLGKCFGLDQNLAMLIAIDSSICGASAVAATAPVLEAKEEETALVIPIGSILGSTAVLGYIFLEHWIRLPPRIYGILTGATLHEIAQVMAASHAVPGALEAGTVTKLMRVLLLVPVIFFIGLSRMKKTDYGGTTPWLHVWKGFPWFILGFLFVGIFSSLVPHVFPHFAGFLALKARLASVAVFLMAMAMGGVGLHVNFNHFFACGLKSISVALIGWLMLASLAFAAIHLWMVF